MRANAVATWLLTLAVPPALIANSHTSPCSLCVILPLLICSKERWWGGARRAEAADTDYLVPNCHLHVEHPWKLVCIRHRSTFTGPELSFSKEEPQRHCPDFLGASGLSWR